MICNVSRSIASGSFEQGGVFGEEGDEGLAPSFRPALVCISMPAWALTGSPGLARPAPRRWTAQPTCLQSMDAR